MYTEIIQILVKIADTILKYHSKSGASPAPLPVMSEHLKRRLIHEIKIVHTTKCPYSLQ